MNEKQTTGTGYEDYLKALGLQATLKLDDVMTRSQWDSCISVYRGAQDQLLAYGRYCPGCED